MAGAFVLGGCFYGGCCVTFGGVGFLLVVFVWFFGRFCGRGAVFFLGGMLNKRIADL